MPIVIRSTKILPITSLPSATGYARSSRTLETIHADEMGVEPPIAHVFFLLYDENLEPAPLPTAGCVRQDYRWGEAEEPLSPKQRSRLMDWRRKNKFRFEGTLWLKNRTVRLVGLADSKAGFGRRRSHALREPQVLRLNKKSTPRTTWTIGNSATAGNASNVVVQNPSEKSRI